MDVEDQPLVGSANTYAAPAVMNPSVGGSGAPTTTVDPSADTATEEPSASKPNVVAVSSAFWVPDDHPPEGLTNTYATPASSDAFGAPTTTATSSLFGVTTLAQANDPRNMQMSLKLRY